MELRFQRTLKGFEGRGVVLGAWVEWWFQWFAVSPVADWSVGLGLHRWAEVNKVR